MLVGMDRLSKRKFGIVCHEKVVRIPLEGDEILRVHGEQEEHGVHLKLELELLKKEKLYAKKWRVKLRRVRAMSMTIQSSVKDKILATSSETSKVENTPAEMLRDLDQQMEKRADDDAAESVRDTIGFEYCLASSSGWINYLFGIGVRRLEALYGRKCRSPVLWAEIRESSLIGPELVQETTDKVVLIKEKLKVVRDRQKSCADNRRKPLEFEVRERVMLKVSPWKGVIRFGKKGKLAPSLHVPLDEIKVDKTLHFVEEPVENSDREVKSFPVTYDVAQRGLSFLKENRPRRFLRSGSQSNIGSKKSYQSSEYESDLGELNGAKIERSG
ncbi:hypothetical protein Tco_1576989 [Tanacetum coccineum]